MSQNNKNETIIEGVVQEALPNTMFRVLINNQQKSEETPEEKKTMTVFLSGKMRLNRIRVVVGDRVQIVPDPYGGKGRVVKRL